MEILKDLFDEKIIAIINLFIKNPGKRYTLTDIANLTKVNVATTFRILNKMVSKGFLKTSLIGKVKIYQLERNEKTTALLKILKKETPLQKFIDDISVHPRIKKIILESKEEKSAKLLMIGDFLPSEKINKLCEKIKEKDHYNITFVELSENQYLKLRDFKNYNLDQKIIWERAKTED